jgi:hypothetical protein
LHDTHGDEELDQSKTSTIQMIYYIVVVVTKRIPIALMIIETNEDIIGADHFIFFVDVVYKSYRVEKQKRDEVDPYDMVYHNLPKKHFVLRKVKPCRYCSTKWFPLESQSFCYRKGNVDLNMSDVPDELRQFFSSHTDQDVLYFRKHIRYFNSHFPSPA